jgi:tetratricopeptide (TPR) repeat protein
MNKKYTYLVIAFLIVASLIAYGRILGNGFINFDDDVYLTENLHIRSGINAETIKWAFSAVVSSNWHPLTLISHALDWSLFKDHAGGHHLINLLLHIGNALLLFLFLNKITKNLWPSAFVAALFALHPLRVESVAWAAERKDVLSMFFGLASLYTYPYYVEKQQLSKYFVCLVLFILGLMTKPMLVTLPFLLLLLDFWPLERQQKALNPVNLSVTGSGNWQMKKKVKKQKLSAESIPGESRSTHPTISHLFWEKMPFFVFAIVSSILTIWAQNRGGAFASLQKLPFSERIMNSFVSYVSYLGKIFWPVDLAVFYPYQHSLPGWQVSGAAAILIIISIAVIYFIKKAPFLFVGWFWYLGTLVPVIGLVQVGRQAMADRYTYLPSIGIGIIVAWGIAYLLPKEKLRKMILIPATIIVIAVLTILTWQQCGYWKNSVEIFSQALRVTRDNYLAHTNLGMALAAEGKNEAAIDNYKDSLRINPNHDNAHYNLANLLVKLGKTEEAISHYREAVRINPYYRLAYNNLGINLAKQRKFDEAIYCYRLALQIEPNDPGIQLNLGAALADKGELPEAIEHFRTAVYLNPNYDDARRALSMALEIERRRKLK